MIESLTAAAPGTTVVVGVDDVHLLDDLSTFVVHQIVERAAAKLVLTVRDGELIPAGTQELWKAGQFDELDLQPLLPDDTTTLLSASLGGSVNSDAACRLWKLTRGNVLYLRHIVEQEVGGGRLEKQHGYWQWIGDPIMPCSLVELIESRIGALPTAVGAVIDALAVGEPIELAALRRITDPDAVEEADTRGLITLEHLDTSIEVRVAHPLYGEVRRKRAAPTRLMRLRGLVANELAAAADRDDIRVVVRRATLSLDSDLTPDADLLIKAAQGAIWLADLPLADRLAEAAVRAGAGPEANFVRAHALSWLSRGQEAEAVLAEVPTSELTDQDHARFTYLRASNMLWALADSARAKELIDDASHITAGQARSCIDALRTVYWFAMDRPDVAMLPSKNLGLEDLPAIVGTETAWAMAAISADAGRATEAVAIADAGYTVATRCFDAPHMRFNIADAHVSALLLAGRVSEALEVAERDAGRQPISRGSPITRCCRGGSGRTRCRPPRYRMSAAGTGSRSVVRLGPCHRLGLPLSGPTARPRSPCAVALARLPPRLPRSTRCGVLFGRWSMSEAWPGRGWPLARAPSVRRSPSCGRPPKRRQLTGIRGRSDLPGRPPPSSGTVPAHPGCAHSNRSSRGRVSALRPASPPPYTTGTRLNWPRCPRISSAWATLWRRSMRPRNRPWRIAVRICVDRPWDVSTRAEALAEGCGGAITPALRQASEPLPLTDREREVVMLLRQGLSNRDIAAQLTLSVRTAEGHIYKAMNKTGTASREELAALLPKRTPQTHE